MKAKLTVKTELEIQLPSRPNFVRTDNKDVVIPIEDLTVRQLRELGDAWTDALINKASERKKKATQRLNKSLQSLKL